MQAYPAELINLCSPQGLLKFKFEVTGKFMNLSGHGGVHLVKSIPSYQLYHAHYHKWTYGLSRRLLLITVQNRVHLSLL
jgi:hypothetical protein